MPLSDCYSIDCEACLVARRGQRLDARADVDCDEVVEAAQTKVLAAAAVAAAQLVEVHFQILLVLEAAAAASAD
jgi:hypothetical protein